MLEQDIIQLIANFEQMEQLLTEYAEVTSVIMCTESDRLEEISDKIRERESIIGKIDFLKKQSTMLIDSGEAKEAEQIRAMLNGNNMAQQVSESFVPLRSAIVGLRSAQTLAAQKDEALKAQFNARTCEVKDELVKLNDEKKKLDYYSSLNSTPVNLGETLDSSF